MASIPAGLREYLRRVSSAASIMGGPRVAGAIAALRGQRSYHGSYSGARMTRLELDWIAALRAADEEVRRDAYALRARARELSRNNPLGRRYGRLVDMNLVGPRGPQHRPRIRDNNGLLSTRLNPLVKDSFAQWGEEVSLDGQHDFVAIQRQLAPNARIDGEVLVRKWTGPDVQNDFGIALEPIDPDQLDHLYNLDLGPTQNSIVMGVERDPHGRRLAYHVWDSPYSWARTNTRTRIAASEIIHVYDPARANQTRGVTDFHAVMMAMHLCGDYAMYEAVAAKIGAAKVVIWKKIVGAITGTGNDGDPTKAEERRPIEELEPGMFGFAPEGYEPANVQIDHPSGAFSQFMVDQKEDISTGLDVSFAALTGNLSKTSFSSARTGTLLERDAWRTKQHWWIREFVVPVYRAWLSEAILVGIATGGRKGLVLDARDFRRLSAVTFTPRGYDYVDPAKDRLAAITGIDNGLWSRHREADEHQIDLEEIFDELELENQMAEARGITITNPTALTALAKLAAAEAKSSDAQSQEETVAGISGNGTEPGANRIAAALRNGGR